MYSNLKYTVSKSVIIDFSYLSDLGSSFIADKGLVLRT
jgi:hypothetical protein